MAIWAQGGYPFEIIRPAVGQPPDVVRLEVFWITGPAALPYLEDGPVTTPEEWDRLTRAFEGNFGLFALWVN